MRVDNITFTSADNFTHSFPVHFHEQYTIGVAVNGIQKFDFQGESCFVEPHSIFLIKPHMVHSYYPVADLEF
ncbi:AraC family ligand binding domain-containing protein [Pedobacter sp. UYP1]|uniref:AraC family ligand binding domain-containing protein n=1 Tax=Pedobacter sp. UYP1 TaxID=1756396 RepID=UPI00339626FA